MILALVALALIWLAFVKLSGGLVGWLLKGMLVMFGAVILWTIAYAYIAPPTTPFMWSEDRRTGVQHEWVPIEEIAPVMLRSAVAAEDVNFCQHWGLDISAIRAALEEGRGRGASTISQQTVKNAYLWHGRSWLRKALEAGWTPLIEAVWGKKRILEVYLNIAEFDEGVFGVEAAAQHYFGVSARDLTALQAARLAAVLPSPKNWSASEPSDWVRSRARSIMDGAQVIDRDGRAACFQ